MPALPLTTTGRKSGQRYPTALIDGTHGDGYCVAASKGGSPSHPLWYLNLVADPAVEVQVGPDRSSARARVASGAERDRLPA